MAVTVWRSPGPAIPACGRARRGLLARLHYLTRTGRARAAAREAGLAVTPRTVRAWLAGSRVEFHRLNQPQVTRPHQRVVEYRTLNVRRWDRIVAAWVADDDDALDTAWVDDAVVDLGSRRGQYEYVTNFGFAA
ncbi:hypothetical protein [Streptomyces sp. NPDC001068]|uniref:hypothetical protein n=1 Tax=Streptomyces sp. NPDC001068 TaxID=3364544 RepID=UPI0036918544